MEVFRYFLLVLLTVHLVFARNRSPLLDEENSKVRVKAAECVFDKQIRELGAVWTPDLGPPIGVLYCMRCTCVPFQKKKRIVARVQCYNIKNQCPVPTCDDPVVLPGKCCKTCPGDISPDTVQDIVPQNVAEVEEKNGKHYAALLTGRSSLVLKNEFVKPTGDLNKNNVVATGRFNIHKRNLYYSFYISENAARPQSLQFIDSQGNILEEFTLSHAGGYVNSLYQNASRKVCGVWRRLAKDYRKLLKQEKMYAVLVWGTKDPAEFSLSGLISKNGALQTELLSALLEPAPGSDSFSMSGTGGTAIVSISTAVTPSINVAIMFNGLFMPSELANVPINITLSMDDRRQVVLQEIARVSKPATDVNVINVSATITQAHLRYLTRGRVLLSVSSVAKPEALRLSGNIMTKASCEMFQSTLSSSNGANPDGVSGMAWLYLNNAGSLIYNIQIDKLPPKENPPMITLIDMSTKKRTELETLLPYFHGDGWANGTLDKLTPRVLEPLYAGDLAINVATTSDNSLIKGKLVAKPVDEARDAPAPVLLRREYFNLSSASVGLAWISVDNECHLHYDVSITGIGDRKMELWMEMYPFIAPGAPFINKELESFQGNSIEGSPVEVLSREELIKLESGVNFLKVKDASSKVVLLMATVTKVSIPPPCRPYSVSADNSIPSLYDHPQIVSTGECFFEEKFYKNEEIWVSSKNPCQMCFCQNGAAKCDFMTCPEINCTDGKKITVEGECCPVCVNNSIPPRDQKCSWNGKSYLPSVKFHPFLIPTGFDLCTECFCDSSDLQIKCSRLDDNEKLCCNKNNCNKKFNINDPLSDDDFVSPDIPEYSIKQHGSEYSKKKENFAAKILEEGGCKNPSNPKKPFANGTEYHPYIDSLGEYKCVTCKCQNGTPNCSRQNCDAQTCRKIQDIKRRKEKFNPSDFCCSPKDCRKLRHKKKHAGAS